MPKLTVNGKEVEFEPGMTLLQVCEDAGAEIPRFCYHERLKIAGNCRMCLVDVEGGPPKPVASCAMPAGDGMVVHTDNEVVKKAREGVMEFLLINHPLDCPICDQGGECDLQDQAMVYGRGNNRFEENKRAVKDKNMGPLVKTHMTRCIHCTRCVRFMTDVAGVQELGAVGRGEHLEITTALEQSLTSELSGNIIDLCPVGALTSRPYAFTSRPWELSKTESIDVLDAVGSNIRVDSRGVEVLRILPRLNEDINEEWISDKTRFACDGLKLQRLDKPYIRRNGKLVSGSWDEAYQAVHEAVGHSKPEKVAAIAGDLADCESMHALKKLMEALKVTSFDCRQDGAYAEPNNRGSYIFNSTISGIEEADFCLLVGTFPRQEAAVLNARLRKAHVENGMPVAAIGPSVDHTYPVNDLGSDLAILQDILKGKHEVSTQLKDAKNPMVIIGSAVLSRDDGAAVLKVVSDIVEAYGVVSDEWNGFNILQRAASRVGGLDLGFVPGEKGLDTAGILKAAKGNKLDVLFLLGADEIDTDSLGDTFVVYLGHHGDAGAHRADVILPVAAYTEKSATYVNTEGRAQRTVAAVSPLGMAKEDWKAVVDLAVYMDEDLGFSTLNDLRASMEREVTHLGCLGDVISAGWKPVGKAGVLSKGACGYAVDNFYHTDAISRVSVTMAKCAEEKQSRNMEAA